MEKERQKIKPSFQDDVSQKETQQSNDLKRIRSLTDADSEINLADIIAEGAFNYMLNILEERGLSIEHSYIDKCYVAWMLLNKKEASDE